MLKMIYLARRKSGFTFDEFVRRWRKHGALGDYRKAAPIKLGRRHKVADFADALTANKARRIAENAGHSFQGLYSFDAAAGALPGVKTP